MADVPQGQDAVAAGTRHGRATLAARWLIHTPSNQKDPAWLAEQAVAVAEAAGLGSLVWDVVVTHHGGLTSEVVNTDAEGRLVLGDGLDFAVRDLAADVVVDVATLTGAATLALGRRHAALFSNDEGLAAHLITAGEDSGELVWRMPLQSDYADLIGSEVADQANAGRGAAAGPGAITAALFLERFVGGTPWAHLDIAGPGRSDADREDLPKGAPGSASGSCCAGSRPVPRRGHTEPGHELGRGQ
ncbi:MAG: hypothetical protein WCF04_13285 [Candidatus Nanopelagicales bacterium]